MPVTRGLAVVLLLLLAPVDSRDVDVVASALLRSDDAEAGGEDEDGLGSGSNKS